MNYNQSVSAVFLTTSVFLPAYCARHAVKRELKGFSLMRLLAVMSAIHYTMSFFLLFVMQQQSLLYALVKACVGPLIVLIAFFWFRFVLQKSGWKG